MSESDSVRCTAQSSSSYSPVQWDLTLVNKWEPVFSSEHHKKTMLSRCQILRGCTSNLEHVQSSWNIPLNNNMSGMKDAKCFPGKRFLLCMVKK